MPLHKEQTGGENHVPHAFTYSTAAARVAATGLTSSDIGKFALQTDNFSVWVLKTASPLTWIDVGGELPGVASPFTGTIDTSGHPIDRRTGQADERYGLCDGSTYTAGDGVQVTTPDMRDRFIVGSGSTYLSGGTGGADTVTLTRDYLPAEGLSLSGETGEGGGHGHALINTTGDAYPSTSDKPYTVAVRYSYNSGDNTYDGQNIEGVSTNVGSNNVAAAPDHNHDLSGASTENMGSGDALDIRPRYYAAAWIMKL